VNEATINRLLKVIEKIEAKKSALVEKHNMKIQELDEQQAQIRGAIKALGG